MCMLYCFPFSHGFCCCCTRKGHVRVVSIELVSLACVARHLVRRRIVRRGGLVRYTFRKPEMRSIAIDEGEMLQRSLDRWRRHIGRRLRSRPTGADRRRSIRLSRGSFVSSGSPRRRLDDDDGENEAEIYASHNDLYCFA